MTGPVGTLRRRVAAARAFFADEDIAEILPAVEAVLRSGRLILGEQTERFEHEFRRTVRTDHAVAVSSCTAALQIVLRFARIRGREVLVPANTFPGVVTAVLDEGGLPVLAEMDPANFSVDAQDLVRRITPRTAAVVLVHIAGLICPGIETVRDACARQGVFLIEDAAHAHGAAIDGRRAGSLGDAGCFSFYPTKIMTTGVGGMITTHLEPLAAFGRLVRHHGTSARGEFEHPGSDWCMSEIQAVLGRQQLRRLEAAVDHRNRVVEWYRERLAASAWVRIPEIPPGIRHAYYKLPVVLDDDLDAARFRSTMRDPHGIENGTVYDPPAHLRPMFQGVPTIAHVRFPVAEKVLRQQFCPPIHSTITAPEVEQVVEAMMATRSALTA